MGHDGPQHGSRQAEHAAALESGIRVAARLRLREPERLPEPGLVRQYDRRGSGRSGTRVGRRDRSVPLRRRRQDLGSGVVLVD